MGYLGYKPADKPLTSADITDSIITSAKIVDGTITNSDVASSIITGQTAETSIAGGDSVLIFDDSASALRKMTRTNFVSGIGGINTPAFYADRNASQTLTTATFTTILFNSELFDTNSNYDTATGRFTPTTAGKYLVYANLIMGDIGDQKFNLCEIHKNGSVVDYGQIFMSGTGQGGTSSASSIISCNGTTDYITVVGYHNKGSNANVETNSVFFGFKLIE